MNILEKLICKIFKKPRVLEEFPVYNRKNRINRKMRKKLERRKGRV